MCVFYWIFSIEIERDGKTLSIETIAIRFLYVGYVSETCKKMNVKNIKIISIFKWMFHLMIIYKKCMMGKNFAM